MIGRESRPEIGGRGLKCPVKEVRMGSQQRSVSKSKQITWFWKELSCSHAEERAESGDRRPGHLLGVILKACREPDEDQVEQGLWQRL